MSELTRALAPDRLRPWHEFVADLWIADPTLTQNELAQRVGKTPAWLSIIVNSDAFRHYMAERKAEFIDPVLAATVEDRLTALANKASEKLIERLDLAGNTMSVKELTGIVKTATTGLGMGPASKTPAIQQNMYVIPAPARPATAQEWVQTVENEVGKK